MLVYYNRTVFKNQEKYYKLEKKIFCVIILTNFRRKAAIK